MKHFLLTFFLFFLFFSADAQQNGDEQWTEDQEEYTIIHQQIDSLYNEAVDIFYEASNTVKDSIYDLLVLAINLSESVGYDEVQAKALYFLGRYHLSVEGDPANGTLHLLQSLEIFTRLGDKYYISRCYMQLGLVNNMIGSYEEANRNFLLSLEFDDHSTTKYLLAINFTEMKQFPEAQEFFRKALADYEKNGDRSNVGQCYLYLGRLYLEMNKIDSSFIMLNKSRTVFKGIKDKEGLIRYNAFISNTYLSENKLDSAIYFAEKSYHEELSNKENLVDDIVLTTATKTLHEAYLKKKNFKQAYFYLDRYNEVSSRLLEGNSEQKVTNMLRMFEFEKKMDQEKAIQQREKAIAEEKIANARFFRNSLITGAALLLLLLLLLYNRYTIKRDAHNTLEEKNRLISEEKERSEELLLNILPDEVAAELKQNGSIESRVIEQVTVLFSDFKGFTSLTKLLTPKELVDYLHECFSEFDRICEKHGLEKIKTIGDAFMAVGGLPTKNKSHAHDAIKVALEFVEFIDKSKEKRMAENRPYFEIRVGLHTGPVIAGIVGLKKFQYDIWGDTVNIANNMESHGMEGRVNISQKTYDLLRDNKELNFESRGKIKVKGGFEIDMWFAERKS